MAKEKDALLAINGSYYGFREDGIEIRNGILYRDVPFRTGLAIYNNGTMGPYTEASDSATKLLGNGVFQAISFGPVLVNSGTLITDFTNTVIDINSSSAAARRPIEGANPRTGIGMIEPNHFVFVVVDGRNPGYSKGATLTEFAKMFYDLGCKEAYNLDGGGSSTMYFNGKIINTPSLGRERSISDILYVTK
jgi:exopolysaccharide biosynthesis protein